MSNANIIVPPGRLVTEAIPPPAAGNQFAFQNGGGGLIEPVYLAALYTPDATGGNRQVSLVLTIAGQEIRIGVIQDTVPPTLPNQFYWLAGSQDYFDFAAVDTSYQSFPPGLLLDTGDIFSTNSTTFGVADTWTNIILAYRLFPKVG